MTNINILLLEDSLHFQAWASSMLEEVFPQHNIFLAESIDGANKILDADEFSIAILDISLPDGSGIEILQRLKQTYADTTCIMSTMFDDHKNIFNALQEGADGYLIKSGSAEEFKTGLECIINGHPPLSPVVARMMMMHFQQNKPVKDEHCLTERQVEILKLIAKGLHNKEVAEELKLSVFTIMDHVKNIYKKLSVNSRTEAALEAQKMGLI